MTIIRIAGILVSIFYLGGCATACPNFKETTQKFEATVDYLSQIKTTASFTENYIAQVQDDARFFQNQVTSACMALNNDKINYEQYQAQLENANQGFKNLRTRMEKIKTGQGSSTEESQSSEESQVVDKIDNNGLKSRMDRLYEEKTDNARLAFENLKKDKWLIHRGPEEIFGGLIDLANASTKRICSVSHGYKGFLPESNMYFGLLDHYLEETNRRRLKDRLRVQRLFVISKSQENDPDFRKVIKYMQDKGTETYYTYKDTIKETFEYAELENKYISIIIPKLPDDDIDRFDQISLASYDNKVLAHQLGFGNPPYFYGSRGRISWDQNEVNLIDPCNLFDKISGKYLMDGKNLVKE